MYIMKIYGDVETWTKCKVNVRQLFFKGTSKQEG